MSRLLELGDRWLNASERVESVDERVPINPKLAVPLYATAAEDQKAIHADESLQRPSLVVGGSARGVGCGFRVRFGAKSENFGENAPLHRC